MATRFPLCNGSVIPLLLMVFSSTAAVDSRPLPVRIPILAPPVTACKAITRAEVIDSLGRSVGEATETIAGAESTCDYATGHGLVTVVIERIAAMPDAAKEITSLQKVVPEASIRNAEGIGTHAFFLDIPGAGTQLHILGEHECLLISILGLGEPADVTAAAERIARKVLPRL